MKFIFYLFFSTCLVISTILNGQSIRKNYQEMTQSEKDELVDAFHLLRVGDDLIDDLAVFHNNNFSSIHFNLPNSPSVDVFLAWHRRQIFEVELALQAINSRLSVPYWDWRSDNSTNSSLWDFNFMGQFNNVWSLNRNLGNSGSLPNDADVINTQVVTNWLDYSNNLERGIVHTGAHNWVGGIMASGASPRDPVFYLHHGMVDKLWQEWVETNSITSQSNIYQATALPRYSAVNPDDIVDSRALGVFYAENQKATLDNYTVSNTYRSTESFYYQYTIVAENGFTVPSGKEARIESVNNITLKPGFHAQNGSEFLAKIDTDANITTSSRPSGVTAANQKKPFTDTDIIRNAYEPRRPTKEFAIAAFPNPTKDFVIIGLPETCDDCLIQVYDLDGKLKLSSTMVSDAKIDLRNLSPGLYVFRLSENGEMLAQFKVVKLQ